MSSTTISCGSATQSELAGFQKRFWRRGAGFIVSRWLCPRLIHTRRLIGVPWPVPLPCSQLCLAMEACDLFLDFVLFFFFFITFFLSKKNQRIKATESIRSRICMSKLENEYYLIFMLIISLVFRFFYRFIQDVNSMHIYMGGSLDSRFLILMQ